MVCVNPSGDEIHDLHCLAQKRPNDSEPCSSQLCQVVWITGEWEQVKKKGSKTIDKLKSVTVNVLGNYKMIKINHSGYLLNCGTDLVFFLPRFFASVLGHLWSGLPEEAGLLQRSAFWE